MKLKETNNLEEERKKKTVKICPHKNDQNEAEDSKRCKKGWKKKEEKKKERLNFYVNDKMRNITKETKKLNSKK